MLYLGFIFLSCDHSQLDNFYALVLILDSQFGKQILQHMSQTIKVCSVRGKGLPRCHSCDFLNLTDSRIFLLISKSTLYHCILGPSGPDFCFLLMHTPRGSRYWLKWLDPCHPQWMHWIGFLPLGFNLAQLSLLHLFGK